MPALATVELHQDAAPVRLIVDVGKQIEALDHSAPFFQGAGELGRAIVSLQLTLPSARHAARTAPGKRDS